MTIRFSGFDVYRTYLAMKQHFSNPKYDFFRYDGKVNAKESTYKQRSDFYFFESLARKLEPHEIKEYLLSNFIHSDNPQKVWIGDIKRTGKDNWVVWKKYNQNLTYHFKQDLNKVIDYMERRELTFDELFTTDGMHPPFLKLFIRNEITLETVMIFDMVLGFTKLWDKYLQDPLWIGLSLKIKKYKPFVSIPVKEYKALIRSEVL